MAEIIIIERTKDVFFYQSLNEYSTHMNVMVIDRSAASNIVSRTLG